MKAQDICAKNMLVARPKDVKDFPYLEADKIYLIDFGSSQQYKLGPGRQPAVKLGPAAYHPPSDMDTFDPYSFDVYCAGLLFRMLAGVSSSGAPSEWVLIMARSAVRLTNSCTSPGSYDVMCCGSSATSADARPSATVVPVHDAPSKCSRPSAGYSERRICAHAQRTPSELWSFVGTLLSIET